MALKIAKFDSSIFTHTIISDTALSGSGGGTATINIDLTQGDSGNLIGIDLTNAHGATMYFKLTLTNTAPVVGTSEPDIMLPVDGSSSSNWIIPEGIPFTNLSIWATTSSGTNATVAASAAFSVILITT